jgi:hypothetical protein
MVNTEEHVLLAQVISHLPVELRQHLAARQLTGRLSKARDIVGLSRGYDDGVPTRACSIGCRGGSLALKRTTLGSTFGFIAHEVVMLERQHAPNGCRSRCTGKYISSPVSWKW